MKKKSKEQLMYDDSWIYTLLLSTIVILGESLKNYSFNIVGIELTYTVLLLPIMFFIVNYITKKYNYKKAISAICLSTVALVLFSYGISYALGRGLSIMDIAGETFAYFLSQLINLNIFIFMLNNSNSPRALVWINYIFSIILFYMIYTLMNLSVLVNDTYWMGYFITLFIQGIECLLLTIIDKYIKRGL